MLINIDCLDNISDVWRWVDVEVNTEDYDAFVISYRLNQSWHLFGVKRDKYANSQETELSGYEISIRSLAQFIVNVDKPILMIRNDFFCDDFSEELIKLLKASDKYRTEEHSE